MNLTRKTFQLSPPRLALQNGGLVIFFAFVHTVSDAVTKMLLTCCLRSKFRFALTETTLALLVATLSLSALVTQPLFGALADRIGHRRIAALGVVLNAVLFSLIGVVRDVNVLFGLILVGGLGSAALHPAIANMAPTTGRQKIGRLTDNESTSGEEQAPIEPQQEVWAAGVTYIRSREARKAESSAADMYQKVYEAQRPEIFSKSLGWRVSGNGGFIRIRRDSTWNVPEPELVLVINSHREIVGYCAGNDVSSRDIKGENPLYLPQAKIYNGSCALGHGILLCEPESTQNIPIRMEIQRAGRIIFGGEANTNSMKRTPPELVEFLTCELDFPQDVFLMTGTCLVLDNFTLQMEDVVIIQVDETKIENKVQA